MKEKQDKLSSSLKRKKNDKRRNLGLSGKKKNDDKSKNMVKYNRFPSIKFLKMCLVVETKIISVSNIVWNIQETLKKSKKI